MTKIPTRDRVTLAVQELNDALGEAEEAGLRPRIFVEARRLYAWFDVDHDPDTGIDQLDRGDHVTGRL